MSAAPAEKKRWTRAEYLVAERAGAEKHELHDGEIFAMAGASFAHNQIVANLVREVGNALGKGSCQILPSDLRVRIPGRDRYKYPDAVIVCGPPAFEDAEQDTLQNPQVLFEVLSDTTERYDRGLKFADYRTLPSLREYVLLSQDRVLVEQYTRQPDGAWLLRALGPGQALHLLGGGCVVTTDELYRNVALPPEPDAQPGG
jgi:Uma2 family endonuclease